MPTGTFNADPLTLNGTGFQGQGALINSVAGAVYTGNITLLGTGPVLINTPTALAVPSLLSGTSDLIKVGAGTLTLQDNNTGFTGNLTIGNNEDFIAAAPLNGGGVTLGLDGTLNQAASYTVNVGGNLTFDNTTYANSTRVDNNQITLNGGVLAFAGNNNPVFTTSETVGSVVLNTGSSTIASINGSGFGVSNVLSISSLTRNAGATLNFSYGGTALGQSRQRHVPRHRAEPKRQ